MTKENANIRILEPEKNIVKHKRKDEKVITK